MHAKEAREASDVSNFNRILDKIKKACSVGYFETYIEESYVEDKHKDQLVRWGYKVERASIFVYGIKTEQLKISWKEE